MRILYILIFLISSNIYLLAQDTTKTHFESYKTKITHLNNLGLSMLSKKDYLKALDCFYEAKKLNLDSTQYITDPYLARTFRELGALSIAIDIYKNEPKKTYNYGTIGALYVELNTFDSALVYFEKQLFIARAESNYIYISSAINNIGITFMRKKEYETAVLFFQNALEIIQSYNKRNKNDSSNIGYLFTKNILSNLGESYYQLNNYQDALYYFKSALTGRNSLNDKIKVYEMMFKSYLYTNQLNNALLLKKEVERQIDTSNINELIVLMRMDLDIAIYNKDIHIIKTLIQEIDDMQKLILLNSKIETDKTSNIVSQFLYTKLNQQIAIERKEKSNLQKEVLLNKRERSLIYSFVIFLLFSIIILGIILYLLNKNKVKKNKLENEILKFEEEKLKHQISVQQNYLVDFAVQKRIHQNHSTDILHKLKHLKSYDKDEIYSKIDSLIYEIRNKESINHDFNELNKHSEDILIKYRIELTKLHPNLNESDINLCILVKLNYSNKQIAEHRKVSDGSVKIFKNRVKKKIGLSPKESLREYLNNIST